MARQALIKLQNNRGKSSRLVEFTWFESTRLDSTRSYCSRVAVTVT